MINDFMNEIMDKFIIEVNKEKNISRIEKGLINPLIHYTFKKVYPYMIIISSIFLLTFLLAIIILFLQLKQLGKNVK